MATTMLAPQARAQEVRQRLRRANVDQETLVDVLRELNESERRHEKKMSAAKSIERRIKELQEELEAQVNEVARHPKVRKLESTWRGLERLVNNTVHSKTLIVEVMDATEESVRADLGSFSEGWRPMDKTNLYYYLYRRGLGVRGGHPYGAIVADFEIGPDEDGMSVLWQMSKIAKQAHAPFIAAASPQMFKMDDFADLNLVTADLRAIQVNDEKFNFNRWNDFRNEDFSCFAGLLVPRILTRAPRSSERIVDARTDYVWGSPVYVYAEILTHAFAEYGWCSAIRGPHATIGDLPIHNLPGGDPATQVGPTNIVYDDSVEYQFDQLGFIAFCKELNSTKAVFPGGHSCHNPGSYSTPEAQASAELSSRLPNVFARSRFAHAVKAMCRGNIGAFADEESLRKELSNWLAQYKLDNPSAATSEQKARKPLLGYSVSVRQVEGHPGVFEASIDLSVHHQIEEVGVTMSLVAELSAADES